jgi:hypothetical protein
MVGKAQESHGARSGLYGGCSDGVPPSTFSKPNTEFNLDLAPCDFWAFQAMKRELQGKKFRLSSTVYSTFSRSGWSVVRSASLAKGGTSKKRSSPHFHKVLIRSNKVSPQSFQTVLVYIKS